MVLQMCRARAPQTRGARRRARPGPDAEGAPTEPAAACGRKQRRLVTSLLHSTHAVERGLAQGTQTLEPRRLLPVPHSCEDSKEITLKTLRS